MGYLLDDLEKTASTIRYDDKGNPMVSMYDDDSIPYIDNFEKNKRTIKRIGPGIAMAGLGVGLNDLKEKFPNSVAKNVPDKLSNGLMLGGTGLAAAGGAYNYIKERNRNKRIAAYDQEKTARSIEGWDLAEEERLGKLWNSPEYQKKQIDELRANYRKVGQKMPGDVNRRHRRMKIGALAAGGMAVGLGAHKLNRMYAQKKKQEEAEQEKTALLSDPDNLWKDQNKPPTLLNALKPKKPHGTTGAVPDYVKGTGRKQPSPLTDLINSRKRY